MNAQTFTYVPESVIQTRVCNGPNPFLYCCSRITEYITKRVVLEYLLAGLVVRDIQKGWGFASPPRSFYPPLSVAVYCLVILMSQCISNTLERAIISENTSLPFASRPRARAIYPSLRVFTPSFLLLLLVAPIRTF